MMKDLLFHFLPCLLLVASTRTWVRIRPRNGAPAAALVQIPVRGTRLRAELPSLSPLQNR